MGTQVTDILLNEQTLHAHRQDQIDSCITETENGITEGHCPILSLVRFTEPLPDINI